MITEINVDSWPQLQAETDNLRERLEERAVTIYCSLEQASVGKIRLSDQPALYVLGPYEKVHERHFLQQSQYTICVHLNKEYKPFYANHELVFKKNEKKQDRLWKINVLKNLRDRALKSLNSMNINAFSLFGTTDSLVDTISTNGIIRSDDL